MWSAAGCYLPPLASAHTPATHPWRTALHPPRRLVAPFCRHSHSCKSALTDVSAHTDNLQTVFAERNRQPPPISPASRVAVPPAALSVVWLMLAAAPRAAATLRPLPRSPPTAPPRPAARQTASPLACGRGSLLQTPGLPPATTCNPSLEQGRLQCCAPAATADPPAQTPGCASQSYIAARHRVGGWVGRWGRWGVGAGCVQEAAAAHRCAAQPHFWLQPAALPVLCAHQGLRGVAPPSDTSGPGDEAMLRGVLAPSQGPASRPCSESAEAPRPRGE